MVTRFPGGQDIARKWFVVDAAGQTLGRLASRVASILAGKESALYTPFIDVGDHVIVINDNHLRRLLTNYFRYYHESRTHLSLEKDAPESRAVQSNKSQRIIQIPQVGGLHHRYERRAA